jgi:hypothetical protein
MLPPSRPVGVNDVRSCLMDVEDKQSRSIGKAEF